MTSVETEAFDLFGDVEQSVVRRLDGWAGFRFATVGTRSARRLLGRRGPGGADSLNGAAVDLDRASAVARAYGEFRERLAASTAPLSVRHGPEVHFSSPAAISKLLSGSGSAVLERAAERARVEDYDWIEGCALYDRSPAWLPAQATYLGHRESSRLTPSYWHWTSNGLAAGNSVEAATLSGLLELVERDRFMYHWCTRRPTTPATARWLEGTSVPGIPLVERVRPWRVRLGRMDTSGLPIDAAICLLVNPEGRPAFAMGAAAGVNGFAPVARKAFLEAVHSVLWGRQIDSRDRGLTPLGAPDVPPGPASDASADHQDSPKGGPGDFEERVRLYADPARLDEVAWLVPDESAGYAPSRVTNARENHAVDALPRLVDALAAQDCRLFAHQLAVPADRFTGVTTMRVLSPDLQPLSQCHRCQLLKPGRLGPGPYNADPHPFP